jgi:hypothetical protein
MVKTDDVKFFLTKQRTGLNSGNDERQFETNRLFLTEDFSYFER